MTSRIRRAWGSLALLASIAGFGLIAPALANEVIVKLQANSAPLYETPPADRAQAAVIDRLTEVSQLIPIDGSRDEWVAIKVKVEGTEKRLWLHKDDVVVMRAPGRIARSPSCQAAAGRTMC